MGGLTENSLASSKIYPCDIHIVRRTSCAIRDYVMALKPVCSRVTIATNGKNGNGLNLGIIEQLFQILMLSVFKNYPKKYYC